MVGFQSNVNQSQGITIWPKANFVHSRYNNMATFGFSMVSYHRFVRNFVWKQSAKFHTKMFYCSGEKRDFVKCAGRKIQIQVRCVALVPDFRFLEFWILRTGNKVSNPKWLLRSKQSTNHQISLTRQSPRQKYHGEKPIMAEDPNNIPSSSHGNAIDFQ